MMLFPQFMRKSELLKAKHIIDRFFENSKEGLTLDGIFEKAYENHFLKLGSKWGVEAGNLYRNHIKKSLGNKIASNISRKEVMWWHKKLCATPTVANRALSVLSKIYSFSEENELLPPGTNPCKGVKPFPERSRKRYATKDELRKIIEILKRDAEKKPFAATFLLILLFTGSRPSALLEASWSQIMEVEKDGQVFGVLSLPGKTTAKTGEYETIVIPPQGMELLEKLPRSIRSDKIFRCSLPHYYWKQISEKVGCQNLWIRDLRRTFATIGLSTGNSMDIIGELLNHRSTNTTKIYAKLTDEKRFESVGNIADALTAI